MDRLRFGTFLAPFHPAGENPTLALQRDLELVEHLDRLGYDEAWIGEHHSAGTEIIASPEIFIAAAAERTKRIKLGTGVTSIAYHNPLWVAERMVLLDHLTRGRDDARLRARLAAHRLDDARAEPHRHSRAARGRPRHHHAAAARRDGQPADEDAQPRRRPAAPAALHRAVLRDRRRRRRLPRPGPGMAGRYGVGLLSIGATLTKDGFDALAHHWNVVQERAAHYGQTVSRRDWRLVGLMHIAETREQAYRDVEYGIETWFRYFQKTAAFPQMAVEGGDVKEMIDFINEAGIGAIGTVEDARAQVQRLWDQSGGFGCMLPARPRVGQPAGHQALLGAHRPARDAALPGRARSATPSRRCDRAQYAMAQARGLRGPADAGRRHHDRALPAGTRRQGRFLKGRLSALAPSAAVTRCSH